MAGIRTTTPGPLAPSLMRPNRKNTARSYSVTTIRIDLRKMARTTKTTITPMTAMPPPLAPDEELAAMSTMGDATPAEPSSVASP